MAPAVPGRAFPAIWRPCAAEPCIIRAEFLCSVPARAAAAPRWMGFRKPLGPLTIGVVRVG
jgi:hypothetical protein